MISGQSPLVKELLAQSDLVLSALFSMTPNLEEALQKKVLHLASRLIYLLLDKGFSCGPIQRESVLLVQDYLAALLANSSTKEDWRVFLIQECLLLLTRLQPLPLFNKPT